MMLDQNNNKNGFNDSRFISEYRSNTKSDLIEITEDKLENILLKHNKELEKKNNWITPLSLFITILIVLLSADFKKFIGIEKEIWNAIFIILLISTFIWTIIASYTAIFKTKESTIETLINQIKIEN